VNACVLDASVAAKWFLPPRDESLVPEALSLFERFTEGALRLSVPDLFWPELGNVLWKAVRQGRMSGDAAEEALRSLSRLDLKTFPSAPLVVYAFAIADSCQCTVYDSTCVALAVIQDQPLVTADERLANALAARFPVRWLGAIA